jgi:hypothetical protein
MNKNNYEKPPEKTENAKKPPQKEHLERQDFPIPVKKNAELKDY